MPGFDGGAHLLHGLAQCAAENGGSGVWMHSKMMAQSNKPLSSGFPERLVRMLNVERVMGIEPTLFAWEAKVLPLNYTRVT